MDIGVPASLELCEEVVDEAILGAHRPRAVPRVHLPENNQISDLNFRALNTVNCSSTVHTVCIV